MSEEKSVRITVPLGRNTPAYLRFIEDHGEPIRADVKLYFSDGDTLTLDSPSLVHDGETEGLWAA